MKRLTKSENSLKLKNNTEQESGGWKFVLSIFISVIVAISILVLMAIFWYNYASLYQNGEMPGVQERIHEETMIQGGFGGY